MAAQTSVSYRMVVSAMPRTGSGPRWEVVKWVTVPETPSGEAQLYNLANEAAQESGGCLYSYRVERDNLNKAAAPCTYKDEAFSYWELPDMSILTLKEPSR